MASGQDVAVAVSGIAIPLVHSMETEDAGATCFVANVGLIFILILPLHWASIAFSGQSCAP